MTVTWAKPFDRQSLLDVLCAVLEDQHGAAFVATLTKKEETENGTAGQVRDAGIA